MKGLNVLGFLFNLRMLAVLVTSFASGLPLALSAGTLQAWYTESGADLMTIGLLSLVGLPYLFKVCWAPLLDRYIPFALGKRKSWLVISQALMAITLLLMAQLNPLMQPKMMALLALLLAFFSASQDIVVDAYRTEISKEDERGIAASYLAVGYRLAMVVSGALTLIIADYFGWKVTYSLMAVLMLLLMLVSWFIPKVPHNASHPVTLKEAVIEPFHDFITRPSILWILIFILIYRLPDAMALSLNSTFLLRDVGFSLAVVGSVGKTAGLIGALLGSVAGGMLYVWLGLYRSLFIFGFFQMLSNLMFAWLGIVGKSYVLLIVSLFSDYFCGGLATVGFVALLMSLCTDRYTATQYALLSAFSAVARVAIGPLSAWCVGSLGWVHFYILTFFVGFPGLWLLRILQKRQVLS